MWVSFESLPAYSRADNPLSDTYDYRALINQARQVLHADAWRCYRKHGRGVIVLGPPKGTLVEVSYGLPARDSAFRDDLTRYDPVSEFLVGIGDGVALPVRVWRVDAQPSTFTRAWSDFDLTSR